MRYIRPNYTIKTEITDHHSVQVDWPCLYILFLLEINPQEVNRVGSSENWGRYYNNNNNNNNSSSSSSSSNFPYAGRFEYIRPSPANRRRRRKRTRCLGIRLGHPVTGGYKYRDLVLPVAGWTQDWRHCSVKNLMLRNQRSENWMA
jgi:hypothetical protein